MNFAEHLMLLRKQRGWSQEELGNQINVTRQTVSKWELGQSTQIGRASCRERV